MYIKRVRKIFLLINFILFYRKERGCSGTHDGVQVAVWDCGQDVPKLLTAVSARVRNLGGLIPLVNKTTSLGCVARAYGKVFWMVVVLNFDGF